MIIFLYGPDSYRRAERARFYIKEFRKKYNNLSVERFDIADPDAHERLDAFIRGQSLFSASKMAVLEGVFEYGDYDTQVLLAHVEKMPPTVTILISEEHAPKEGWKFLLDMKAPSLAAAFEDLKGEAWRAFLKKVSKEKGASLDAETLHAVAEEYAGDSWGAATEIDRLVFLAPRLSGRFSEERTEKRIDAWQAIRTLAGGSRPARVAALEKLFSQGESAAKIFSILSYQRQENLGRFARYDIAIKLGKLGYEEALLDVAIG